jgi:hypothetical protein
MEEQPRGSSRILFVHPLSSFPNWQNLNAKAMGRRHSIQRGCSCHPEWQQLLSLGSWNGRGPLISPRRPLQVTGSSSSDKLHPWVGLRNRTWSWELMAHWHPESDNPKHCRCMHSMSGEKPGQGSILRSHLRPPPTACSEATFKALSQSLCCPLGRSLTRAVV